MVPAVSLGTTGLDVTRMGLGLAALGRPGYINLGHAEDLEGNYAVEAMAAQTAEMLDLAWEAGIRYIDTARGYGRAEEFLARWLESRAIAPDAIVVGSKWGYRYTANWEVEAESHEEKEHSLPMFQQQLEETLSLLGAHLDLYMVHSATLESGILERGDVLDAMGAARAEGRIPLIGLTVSGPSSEETLRRAREIEYEGERLFEVVQATWNILEPSLGPLLSECHDSGMGIVIKEALANGRLTPRNRSEDFRERYETLSAVGEGVGASIDQIALAAVLDQPWVDCVLSGAATPEHLRSNLGAFTVRLDEEAREVLASLAEPVAQYYRKRADLEWN